MSKKGYVYILTNKNHTVFYCGITAHLVERIAEHKNGQGSKFTRKYNIHKLVYYEEYDRIEEAIAREKYVKGKGRKYKVVLIRSINPEWNDLYGSLI